MIKDSVAFIANYLWRESIRNLSNNLEESEIRNFNSNDYYYLTTIYYMNKPTLSQLAEALNLTKPAISVINRKLTGMGLVEKVQSSEDRRVFHICMTTKGKKIVEGDELLYGKIDSLIRHLTVTDEKYQFVESLMKEIVTSIENI